MGWNYLSIPKLQRLISFKLNEFPKSCNTDPLVIADSPHKVPVTRNMRPFHDFTVLSKYQKYSLISPNVFEIIKKNPIQSASTLSADGLAPAFAITTNIGTRRFMAASYAYILKCSHFHRWSCSDVSVCSYAVSRFQQLQQHQQQQLQ